MGTKTAILKHAVLPGIIPRIAALFRSGFTHMAYMIAIIYGNVRLLPPQHPYLLPENIGRFGIRHVIAEAANNLTFNRKNLDQTIIFFTILAGLVLLLLQFVLIILAIMAEQPALAQLSLGNVFNNPNPVTGAQGPEHDVAFMLLERVFGIVNGAGDNGFFGSCISNALGTAPVCVDMNNAPYSTPTSYPFAFHTALHKILQFYSYGIFLVGVMVIIYFVITIVAETAQTGIPFGQRFNKAWVPVRFILFFALIIPINTTGTNNVGINGAQFITFHIVKAGSNMATNAWSIFNGAGSAATAAGSGNYMVQDREMIATPQHPKVADFMRTMFVAHTCRAAYNIKDETGLVLVDAYMVRPEPPAGFNALDGDTNRPVVAPATESVTPNAHTLDDSTTFDIARQFASGGNIVIRFGQLGKPVAGKLPPEFQSTMGNVKPLCGEVTMQLTGLDQPGAVEVYKGYFEIIRDVWNTGQYKTYASCVFAKNSQYYKDPGCLYPGETFKRQQNVRYTNDLEKIITAAMAAQTGSLTGIDPVILRLGWAGASLWYNEVAKMNGAVISAVLNFPNASELPTLMKAAQNAGLMEDEAVSPNRQFLQALSDATGMNTVLEIDPNERDILMASVAANNFWLQGGGGSSSNFEATTGNLFVDFVNGVLGTDGLFEMRKNTNVHPLAQITALGKGMMEAVVRNAATGVAAKAGSGVLGITFGSASESLIATMGGFFFSMTMVTMGMSFVLYYLVPFMPFIYFFFAISGWIKSIFEAIVAMPLWALGHLRIDGEGLAGPGASNGYFLLLEIFLRPTLIIIGFVASISVFSALVSVLNQIFDLIVGNVGGFDNELEAINPGAPAGAGVESFLSISRGPIDEFFYTVMYTIIVYLIGMSTFKLVDTIPNQIMRWIGVTTPSFQENMKDPVATMSSNIYRGGILVGNQITGRAKGDLAVIAQG